MLSSGAGCWATAVSRSSLHTLFMASIPAIMATVFMHHYTRAGELGDPALLFTPCDMLLHYLASDPCWFPWMCVRHTNIGVSSPYFTHNPLESPVFLFSRLRCPMSFLLPSGQPFLYRILCMLLPWTVSLCPQRCDG